MIESASNTSRRQVWLARMRQRDACWVAWVSLTGLLPMLLSCPCGRKSPALIQPIDIRDLITPVKFGDDRLKGLGMADGQILPFPITRSLSRPKTPQPIVTKFESRDYVADIYGQKKFGLNPCRGFFSPYT